VFGKFVLLPFKKLDRRIRIRIRITSPLSPYQGKGSNMEPQTLPFCKGIHTKKIKF